MPKVKPSKATAGDPRKGRAAQPRRYQDRNKYEPHQGKREMYRRMHGGFWKLARVKQWLIKAAEELDKLERARREGVDLVPAYSLGVGTEADDFYPHRPWG